MKSTSLNSIITTFFFCKKLDKKSHNIVVTVIKSHCERENRTD